MRICHGHHASARKLQVLVCLHLRLSLQSCSGVGFFQSHILLWGFFSKALKYQSYKFKNTFNYKRPYKERDVNLVDLSFVPSIPESSFTFSCFFVLCLTVGLGLSVPAVGGRYMPATGCAVRGETRTTWHALRATHVRGSCPRERSLVWWRRRSCVGSTTTPWWRTSRERLRAVSSKIYPDVHCILSRNNH